MSAIHHRDFLHQLRELWGFIEFNIFICILIGRKRRTHSIPAPSPAIQSPTQPQPHPAPRTKRKPPKPWDHALDFKDKKRNATATSWPTSYTPTSQGARILSGCHLPFLPDQGMHTPPHQEFSHQFQEVIRSLTKTGNNPETSGDRRDLHLLAVSLVGWPHRHLQICPPRSAEPSLLNFRTNTCTALIPLMNVKGWRISSEPD